MPDTLTSIKTGKVYDYYNRETEVQRIVMLTDADGEEHTISRPRSFSFFEIGQELLEQIEEDEQ